MMSFFPPLIVCIVVIEAEGVGWGGLAVLVRPALDTTLLDPINYHESLTLKVFYCGRSLRIFLCVYRAPDSPPQFLHDLHEHTRDSIFPVD